MNIPTFNRSSIVRQMANPVEILVNIVYLLKQDRRNSAVVMQYADMADSQVKLLMEIMRQDDATIPVDGQRVLFQT